MTLAEDIGVHVAARTTDTLPEDAFREARILVQDYFGVAIRGCTTDAARIVSDYQVSHAYAPAEASLMGRRTKVAAPAAAFANAVAAHSIELDDVDQDSFLHFSAPVVSAAFAAAESVGASGRSFLVAVITGCEVMQALSDAVNPGLRDRGFHGTSVCGTFGATAAAASIFGLSAEQATSAMGIAGAHAGGVMEIYGPTMQKRIQPGPAAQAGIVSARLAGMGYQGAPSIFDGPRGLFQAWTDEFDVEAARLRLASGAPLGIEFKPYACFRPIHTAVDCALEVRTRVTDPEDIVGLRLLRHPMWADYHLIPEPRTVHEAQGSINHALAVALVEGRAGFDQFGAAAIADTRVARLSRMLQTQPDDRLARGDSCALRVDLADGTVLETSADYPRGSVHLPMSAEDHRNKFLRLAAGTLGAEEAVELISLIATLDEAPDLRKVGSVVLGPETC